MRNKEYRELQVSSSQLVFVFLGILVLGIAIFLLGVSVGKKQAQIITATQLPTEKLTAEEFEGELKEEQLVTKKESPIKKELASHQTAIAQSQKKDLTLEKKNLYYVQVGAFNNQASASSFAARFKSRGYPVLVLDPFPTDKKTVFRVRIGGFSTKEKAAEIKDKLIQEAGKKRDYFIIID